MMAAQLPKPPELRIFPLHGILEGPACTCSLGAACKSIGKHPLVKWRSYDENTKGPSGGYGIQTGHFNGIFVVDLDVKNGKNGAAALEALAAGRPIPDTLSVITPSGGGHLYFRLPADVYVPTTHSVLGPGIDIQGEGSYVVGPGSPHKNGGIYQDVPGPLADPPAWLLELVIGQSKASEPIETEHYTEDPESPRGIRAIEWAKAYLAEAEPAVLGQGGSDRLFAACCRLMYSALPLIVLRGLVEEIYNPRCEPPWSTQEIEHKLVDADRRFTEPRGLPSLDFVDRLHNRTKHTEPREKNPEHSYSFAVGARSNGEARKASFSEIASDLVDHVDWAGVWVFDAFRSQVFAINPPMKLDAETEGLSDADIHRVRFWFEYHGKRVGKDDLGAAIDMIARNSPFNPIQDYLTGLEWDGVTRLDTVLPELFQTRDGPYERAIGPRWFLSLVARAMEPGCQSDSTMILEGHTGFHKTSAFLALMHDPTWFAGSTCGVDHKDFKENLRGIWLVAFDELANLSKGSIEKVKNELTERRDRYRRSYGRNPEGFPRTCGFCGSTNSSQYLNDPTGARRFWPVRVLRDIDISRLVEARDQLWAEAFVRWRRGDVWHIDTPELRTLCEAEQEERYEVDGWEEAIVRWFNDPTKFSRTPVIEEPGSVFRGVRRFDGSQGVTTADVLENAIGKLKGNWTSGDSQRIGRILRRLKMERNQVRVGTGSDGVREWRYVFSTTCDAGHRVTE